MLLDFAFVIAGLALLLVAGDLLVRGAVGLATALKAPSLLIGLTVVAFGTSAPELFVSIDAVLTGRNGIAIGNIVGSNIANVLLVLGLPAVLAAIPMSTPGMRRHASTMLVATAMFCFAIYVRGTLDTPVGIVFIATITLYILYIGYQATRGAAAAPSVMEEVAELEESCPKTAWKTALFIIGGLVGLPLGGSILVSNGAALATDLGVREEIVGLTIIAFGTSLPELATVWAAGMRREADVAVGNIIGSNIFNILFVGGAAGLVATTPFDDPWTRLVDVPVMILATLILAALVYTKRPINRLFGVILTLGYIAYIALLSTNASGAL